MSMTTRCPACGTAFRVTPQQLQAQHGTVRCGRCAHVFDGFKTLATLPDETPVEAAPQADPIAPAPAVEPARAPAASPYPAPPAEPAMPAYGNTAITAAPLPLEDEETLLEEPPRRSGGWVFGILLMLLALAAQGAYYYRSEIAARVPEARPQLSRMCEWLRCAVALPQQPEKISIEASDIQGIDPANPGLIVLTVTLRNNAATDLGYPSLDVVLTNAKDHTIARRIFVPAEYLDPAKNARAGIAPNAEITVRLPLDTGDLGAAGFRVALLPAPAR